MASMMAAGRGGSSRQQMTREGSRSGGRGGALARISNSKNMSKLSEQNTRCEDRYPSPENEKDLELMVISSIGPVGGPNHPACGILKNSKVSFTKDVDGVSDYRLGEILPLGRDKDSLEGGFRLSGELMANKLVRKRFPDGVVTGCQRQLFEGAPSGKQIHSAVRCQEQKFLHHGVFYWKCVQECHLYQESLGTAVQG